MRGTHPVGQEEGFKHVTEKRAVFVDGPFDDHMIGVDDQGAAVT